MTHQTKFTVNEFDPEDTLHVSVYVDGDGYLCFRLNDCALFSIDGADRKMVLYTEVLKKMNIHLHLDDSKFE